MDHLFPILPTTSFMVQVCLYPRILETTIPVATLNTYLYAIEMMCPGSKYFKKIP